MLLMPAETVLAESVLLNSGEDPELLSVSFRDTLLLLMQLDPFKV